MAVLQLNAGVGKGYLLSVLQGRTLLPGGPDLSWIAGTTKLVMQIGTPLGVLSGAFWGFLGLYYGIVTSNRDYSKLDYKRGITRRSCN
jgi:hypothetical protein